MAEGYFDFVAGAGLAAANLEDYCERQGIMRFASAAARDSALAAILTEGLFAYLKDVNTITVYTGSTWSTLGPVHGAWTSYTPTWSGTLGNGTLQGLYMRFGRLIIFRIALVWGSTTSHAAASQTFTAPVATDAALGIQTHGATAIFKCAGTKYGGISDSTSTTLFNVMYQSGAALAAITNAAPGTFTTNDWVQVTGTYQAAADA